MRDYKEGEKTYSLYDGEEVTFRYTDRPNPEIAETLTNPGLRIELIYLHKNENPDILNVKGGVWTEPGHYTPWNFAPGPMFFTDAFTDKERRIIFEGGERKTLEEALGEIESDVGIDIKTYLEIIKKDLQIQQ